MIHNFDQNNMFKKNSQMKTKLLYLNIYLGSSQDK